MIADRLTIVLLALSTFLFTIILRFSRRYMMGDPGAVRFRRWLMITGGCALGLVLARNLVFFALAWLGVSLALHRLLRFYSNRPGAVMAARKKFLISRLGDLAMAGGLVLTYREFGTWQFGGIFAAVEQMRTAGNVPVGVHWLCGLFVFAALLKSAQFPFHSWLPDTMETPTPVSALMHAGIINAGGILILRMSPLVSLSAPAMTALAIIGGFTALFGSVVMLTQASVKRYLAFSTVAQMGFMMLECGLGAFHLALLHLVAHSLYKAYAFLSSGEAVHAQPEVKKRPLTVVALLLGLGCALVMGWATALAFDGKPMEQPALTGIFILALAQLLWSFWSGLERAWQALVLAALGVMFSATYFALERFAGYVVSPVETGNQWLAVLLLPAFLAVTVAQTRLAALARTGFGARLYIHARNGFYFNTLANRMTAAVWAADWGER